MRALHSELFAELKEAMQRYYDKTDQWIYDYKDVAKYMLIDHIQKWEALNTHAMLMIEFVDKELNKRYNS